MDGIAKDDAIFATNTSSLPVIDQAAVTGRPERFLGLHYFNPAQVMKLVEVVRCVTTSDETFADGAEVRGEPEEARGPDQGQGRLHRQPAARALHARRDPRLRGGRRHHRRDRRRHEGRRRPPDGAAHARRLRGPRHHGLDLRRDVRRVPRAPLRPASDAAARCWRRAGTARSRGRASTTTRATSPWPTRSSRRQGNHGGWCHDGQRRTRGAPALAADGPRRPRRACLAASRGRRRVAWP